MDLTYVQNVSLKSLSSKIYVKSEHQSVSSTLIWHTGLSHLENISCADWAHICGSTFSAFFSFCFAGRRPRVDYPVTWSPWQQWLQFSPLPRLCALLCENKQICARTSSKVFEPNKLCNQVCKYHCKAPKPTEHLNRNEKLKTNFLNLP